MLATSGLMTLTVTASHATDDADLLRSVQHPATALDRTGFAIFSGLLVAGISVTRLLGRVQPASIAATVWSSRSSVNFPPSPLNERPGPAARFGGSIWLTAGAVTLRSDSPPAPIIAVSQPRRVEDAWPQTHRLTPESAAQRNAHIEYRVSSWLEG
jgi:hypothetical protein